MTIPRQVQVLEHLTTIIVNDSTCRGRSVGGSGRCAVDNGYGKALNCLGVSKGLAAAETDHAPYSRMFPQVNTVLDVLLTTKGLQAACHWNQSWKQSMGAVTCIAKLCQIEEVGNGRTVLFSLFVLGSDTYASSRKKLPLAARDFP